MYSIWCEWDIGAEGKVFNTLEGAEKFARESLLECGIEDDFDELMDFHLVGFRKVEVVI